MRLAPEPMCGCGPSFGPGVACRNGTTLACAGDSSPEGGTLAGDRWMRSACRSDWGLVCLRKRVRLLNAGKRRIYFDWAVGLDVE